MRDSGLVGGIVPGALKGGNRCPRGLPRCTSSFRRRDAARGREGRHGSSAGDNGGERRRHFVDEDCELCVRNYLRLVDEGMACFDDRRRLALEGRLEATFKHVALYPR